MTLNHPYRLRLLGDFPSCTEHSSFIPLFSLFHHHMSLHLTFLSPVVCIFPVCCSCSVFLSFFILLFSLREGQPSADTGPCEQHSETVLLTGDSLLVFSNNGVFNLTKHIGTPIVNTFCENEG